MEVNVEEAITNNVQGTRNIVEVALNYGVERLVLISTDKAIRPSSVYGATKRLGEMLVLDAPAVLEGLFGREIWECLREPRQCHSAL